MKKVIGIDLGTTNSVLAFKDIATKILRNQENQELTRSCVAFRDNEMLVGQPAFQLFERDPQNTILSIKRLMGESFNGKMAQTMIAETKKTRGYYKYPITQLKGGTSEAIAVVLGGKQYTPEQISSEILKKLKKDAEFRLGDEVTHAVITVPAYFTENQKNATKLAAQYAKLKVLKLLAEPTAAAIAYGVDNLKAGEAKTVLIYDFGGGTFDLSILNIVDGQYLEMGTGGDRWLGGDDLDKALTEYIYKEVSKKYNLNPANIDALIERLPPRRRHKFLSEFRVKTEDLKIGLSSAQSMPFILEDILEDEEGEGIDINIKVTRQDFEELARPYIQKSIDLIEELFKTMGYDISMIDSILLVGGTSCIPLVKEMLIAKYGISKIKVSEKPMLAVAEGAAILAHRLGDDWVEDPTITEGVLQDVAYSANHDMFIEYRGANNEKQAEKFIEQQMPLPQHSVRKFKTMVDNQPIIKIHILTNVENGGLETNNMSFLTIPPDMPKGSEITFEFDLDINENLSILVYPSGQKAKAKPALITRGQKDAKAFATIDTEIQKFLSGDYSQAKIDKFMVAMVTQLKNAEKIDSNDPLDERWAKITYEVMEKAVQIKSEPEQEEPSDYTTHARILINEYHELIRDSDLDKMRKLCAQIEQADQLQAEQLQSKLGEAVNQYQVLLHIFLLNIAADKAARINTNDAQQLHKMHDAIIFHFKNKSPKEAFATLDKATEIAEIYLPMGETPGRGTEIGK